ncbi:unnamed protein product [Rotaria sp. Silwood2]|nr:unnamed protein product [Rotaria sp. Silwood2]CAF4090454.1 unnamed protein product [Rotaria sp. Silwood2]
MANKIKVSSESDPVPVSTNTVGYMTTITYNPCYGCSVAHRQIPITPLRQLELKNESSLPIKQKESSTTIMILSQPQSSPIIHFANQHYLQKQSFFLLQQQYAVLDNLPQSTPISSSILPLNILDNPRPKEIPNEKMTPLKTKLTIRFELFSITNDQIIYRPPPPPLLALSQTIRRKYLEQLIEIKLNNQLRSIKDLPISPTNYSFVFHGIISTYILRIKKKKNFIFFFFFDDN